MKTCGRAPFSMFMPDFAMPFTVSGGGTVPMGSACAMYSARTASMGGSSPWELRCVRSVISMAFFICSGETWRPVRFVPSCVRFSMDRSFLEVGGAAQRELRAGCPAIAGCDDLRGRAFAIHLPAVGEPALGLVFL